MKYQENVYYVFYFPYGWFKKGYLMGQCEDFVKANELFLNVIDLYSPVEESSKAVVTIEYLADDQLINTAQYCRLKDNKIVRRPPGL